MNAVVIVVVLAVLITVGVAAMNVLMRRRGYAIPGRAAVRCSRGHLFRTVWIEGGSLKAVRLGPTRRYMRCPVGSHWSIVRPVREADLTDAERSALDARR